MPTIYEILDIKPPKVVDGFEQDPIDGVSMAYTFADAKAETHKHTQYFDNNGSRGIYHDGWYACTFGPLVPWDAAYNTKLGDWDSAKDVWELYDLTKDFSQAENLAGKEPERLAKMKDTLSGRSPEEQGVPDWRRHLASSSSRGPHLDALQKLAVRRDHDANAGVCCAGTWPREQPCHD